MHTSARVVSIRTDAPCASVFFSSELSSTLKGFFFFMFFCFFLGSFHYICTDSKTNCRLLKHSLAVFS